MGAGASDSDLVRRLRSRHPGAFDELYRQHREPLWRFVRQLAGRTDAAHEIFQDTWVAVARHAHGLREDTALRTWLFTIARNRCRNAARDGLFEARRRESVRGEPLPGPPAPDVEVDQRRRAREVATALASLPEAHREVLLLCVVEGLETQDVARILNMTPEAVRKRLSRARADLAARVGRKDE